MTIVIRTLVVAAMAVSCLACAQRRVSIDWIRAGHNSVVETVAFTPDGTGLITGSSDTTIKRWNIHTGALIATVRGHAVGMTGIEFAPDGIDYATSGRDGFARVRRRAACDPLLELPVFGWVFGLAYSPDGTRLATVNRYGDVAYWDLSTGMPLWMMLQEGNGFNEWALSVDVSPDGTQVASGGQFPRIDIWDAETGNMYQSLEGHTLGILSVVYSPDGSLLASASGDTTVKLWAKDAGENWIDIGTLTGHTDSVNEVRFFPGGNLLASASSDGTIKIWNVQAQSLVRTLIGHVGGVTALAVSADGRYLASGDTEGEPAVWDAASGALIRKFGHLWSSVGSVVYSPQGDRAFSGEGYPKNILRAWDAGSGQPLWHVQVPGDIFTISVSPDGSKVAAGNVADTIELRNSANGQIIRTLVGHSGNVLASVWVANDRLITSAGHPDNTLKLWNTATGESLRTFAGNTADVFSLAIAPDGLSVVSGGMDRVVRKYRLADGSILWQTPSGGPIGHTFWVFSVAVSSDGQVVASAGGDGTIRLWSAATGAPIDVIEGLEGGRSYVQFSPDGRWLASGNLFRLRYYRTSDWSLAFMYDQETGSEIWSLAFSPDSRRLLLGRLDSVVIQSFVPSEPEVAGDTNADGCVDDTDLTRAILEFGVEGCALNGDVNSDGVVDDADVTEIILHFGEGC